MAKTMEQILLVADRRIAKMSHRLNRTSWLALLFAGLLSGFIVIVLISEIGGPRDAPSLAPTNEINAPQLKPNPNTGTAQANKPNPNTGTAQANKPNPNTGTAPASWTQFARSAYETEWMICYEPWSQLLADAGMSESIPYSRSALTQVASKLEYGPNGFDPRGAYASTAVKGCVDGFLAFLNTNRPAAMP